MNDFFPEDIKDAADKMGSDYIKGSEFDGAGLTLKLTKPLEKIKANNPKYGANDKDFLVKNEILEEGETFRFVFEDAEGQIRTFDSKSAPFFLGFKQCNELGVGDWVHISRTGKTTETRYEVEKVDGFAAKVKKADAPNPDDIPF